MREKRSLGLHPAVLAHTQFTQKHTPKQLNFSWLRLFLIQKTEQRKKETKAKRCEDDGYTVYMYCINYVREFYTV